LHSCIVGQPPPLPLGREGSAQLRFCTLNFCLDLFRRAAGSLEMSRDLRGDTQEFLAIVSPSLKTTVTRLYNNTHVSHACLEGPLSDSLVLRDLLTPV
jgi:hypothetical protein